MLSTEILLSWETQPSSELTSLWIPASQTLLSLVAVAVAIYVPWKQRDNDRRDRKAKAKRKSRSIAVALLPTLDAIVERLEKISRLPRDKLVEALVQENTADLQRLLDPGEQLRSLAINFFDAGKAGTSLQDGYYALLLANRRLKTAIEHPRQPGKEVRESQQNRAHDIQGRASQARMKFMDAMSQMRDEFPDIQKGFIYGSVNYQASEQVSGQVSPGPGHS